MKKMTRRSKFLVVIIFVISAIVVTGAIIGFFVEHTANITVLGVSFEWDGQSASNLETSEDFNLCAGETVTFNHTLEYTGDADNITVAFNWSEEVGITSSIIYNDIVVESMLLEKGILYNVKTQYVGDVLLASGNYQIKLSID